MEGSGGVRLEQGGDKKVMMTSLLKVWTQEMTVAGGVGRMPFSVWISVWETLVQLRKEDPSGVAGGPGSGTMGLQGHPTILFLFLQPWLDPCVNRCQHRFLFPWIKKSY